MTFLGFSQICRQVEILSFREFLHLFTQVNKGLFFSKKNKLAWIVSIFFLGENYQPGPNFLNIMVKIKKINRPVCSI